MLHVYLHTCILFAVSSLTLLQLIHLFYSFSCSVFFHRVMKLSHCYTDILFIFAENRGLYLVSLIMCAKLTVCVSYQAVLWTCNSHYIWEILFPGLFPYYPVSFGLLIHSTLLFRWQSEVSLPKCRCRMFPASLFLDLTLSLEIC